MTHTESVVGDDESLSAAPYPLQDNVFRLLRRTAKS